MLNLVGHALQLQAAGLGLHSYVCCIAKDVLLAQAETIVNFINENFLRLNTSNVSFWSQVPNPILVMSPSPYQSLWLTSVSTPGGHKICPPRSPRRRALPMMTVPSSASVHLVLNFQNLIHFLVKQLLRPVYFLSA